MNILAPDGLAMEGRETLLHAGFELDLDKIVGAELARVIGNYDALVVRSATEVTREIIKAGAAKRFKLAARAGIGYNTIDVDAASEYGIVVKNEPTGNTISVAELVLTLMGDLARNIIPAHQSAMKNHWHKSRYQGILLRGKTLGIIGYGRIGKEVGRRAEAFGMELLRCDPRQEPGTEYVALEYLLANSDFITIHINGDNQILGPDEFDKMTRRPYILNLAREGVIDINALCDALVNGKISGVASDVHGQEPQKDGDNIFETPLQEYADTYPVIILPHLGASTKEGQIETSRETARVVVSYLVNRDFSNAVNVENTRISMGKLEGDYLLWVFNRDVPGAFGEIGDTLGKHKISIGDIASTRMLDKNQTVMLGKALSIYSVRPDPPVEYPLQALENAVKALRELDGVVLRATL